MQIKKTIAVGTVSLAALLAGGAAIAAGHGSAPMSADSETTAGADTDNVQQGDQTSPDVSGAARVRSGAHKAATAGKHAASRTSTTASGSTSTGTTGSDGTGSETESDQETEGSSDGPGGHQDPPGNVDHQFQGEE